MLSVKDYDMIQWGVVALWVIAVLLAVIAFLLVGVVVKL